LFAVELDAKARSARHRYVPVRIGSKHWLEGYCKMLSRIDWRVDRVLQIGTAWKAGRELAVCDQSETAIPGVGNDLDSEHFGQPRELSLAPHPFGQRDVGLDDVKGAMLEEAKVFVWILVGLPAGDWNL
jgi:hypothetical protein